MRTCTEPDCQRRHAAHGWCYAHWRQWKRTGKVGAIARPAWVKLPTPTTDRFWEKVAKGKDCWLWTGAHTAAGYGVMFSGGRMELAHRLGWTIAHGTVPPRMYVLHRCDNPQCVRPDHLFLGTPRDNTLDMVAKGRHGTLRGERHQAAKITEAQAAEIKDRVLRKGERQVDICREMGLRQSMVSAIVNGRNWRHVI